MLTKTDLWNEDAQDMHELMTWLSDKVGNRSDLYFYDTSEAGVNIHCNPQLALEGQVFIDWQSLVDMKERGYINIPVLPVKNVLKITDYSIAAMHIHRIDGELDEITDYLNDQESKGDTETNAVTEQIAYLWNRIHDDLGELYEVTIKE